MQNNGKYKSRAPVDLWYPSKKYTDDRYTLQNPESKYSQIKKLRTMTSLTSDSSDYSSLTRNFSTKNIIWKNKRGEINRILT